MSRLLNEGKGEPGGIPCPFCGYRYMQMVSFCDFGCQQRLEPRRDLGETGKWAPGTIHYDDGQGK